jgi:predicted metal-binding membrane protein
MPAESFSREPKPPASAPLSWRVSAYWPWTLVIAAWALIWLIVWTRQQYLLSHDYLLVESGLPWPAALLLFLAGWQVMLAAMMVPSSLPLLPRLLSGERGQRSSSRQVLSFLAGYALIWTGFAVVAFLGDTLIHRLVAEWFWFARHAWLIGAATLVLAGCFQCSPLKAGALCRCRTAGSNEQCAPGCRKQGWRPGMRHGRACLGSCWALMLVMFGIGSGGVLWMAGLTGVMVVEKAAPGGRWLSPVVGGVLLLLAVVWVLQPGARLLIAGL